jgi:hypothetical protein
MVQPKRTGHWLMPWLAPILVGAAYLVALWVDIRETSPITSAEVLSQLLFAAPLVVTVSVVFAVGEQELRTIFSLDVFAEGGRAQQVAFGLLMHNLPALALLLAALPLAGAALFPLIWMLHRPPRHAT